MTAFVIQTDRIDCDTLKSGLADAGCGACVTFEGWVRNSNEGRDVVLLEYETYAPIAESEGARVLAEALQKFDVRQVHAVHRSGSLDIGECAVWVGVAAPHRDAAFEACRYIIDEIKVRLPIWKKEHYSDGDSGWVNCERCDRHRHVG